MGKNTFFYLIAGPTFVIVLLAMFLFFRFLGHETSSFLPEFQKIIRIREYIVKRKMPDYPRIFIASGSNSLFGIDASVLEKKLHYPVINLGLHAAIPQEAYYHQLKKYAGKGDVIILPFEFYYYERTRQETILNTAADFLFESDYAYLRELALTKRLAFFCKYSREWGEKALFEFFSQKNRAFRKIAKQEVINTWLATPTTNIRYASSALDRSGCMLIHIEKPFPYFKFRCRQDPKLFNPDKTTRRDYFAWPPAVPPRKTKISADFIEIHKAFQKYCKKRGITVIFTWPVIAKYDHEFFSALYWGLKDHGIELRGSPLQFFHHEDFFLDSRNHLNKRGAQIRSANIADVVKPLLPRVQNKFMDELLRLFSCLKKEQSSIKEYFAHDCLIVSDSFAISPDLISGLWGNANMHFYQYPDKKFVLPRFLLSEFILVPDNLHYLGQSNIHTALYRLAESLLKNRGIGKNYRFIDSFGVSRDFSLHLFKRVKTISREEVNQLYAQDAVRKSPKKDFVGFRPNQIPVLTDEDIKYVESAAAPVSFSASKPFHATVKDGVLYLFSPKESGFLFHMMNAAVFSHEKISQSFHLYFPVECSLTPENCRYHIFAYRLPPQTDRVQISFATSFVTYNKMNVIGRPGPTSAE